jgi:hypothetical protein
MTDPSPTRGSTGPAGDRVAAWDGPVLRSVVPAIEGSRHVTTDPDAIAAVAGWMAWEEFEPIAPPGRGPDGDPGRDPATVDAAIDYALVTTAINFAYTDFSTGVPYAVEHEGRRLVDAEALFLRFDQAIARGVPLLDGAHLAGLTADGLAEVLHGPVPIPMLAERAEVLNAIGRTLVERYDGRFHVFVRSCRPACFAGGEGLIDRLVAEFPHFDDSSTLRGHDIHLFKLVQLGAWTLHRLGLVELGDLDRLSAFPDYIVPAALRAMGVLVYADELAGLVDARVAIDRGSDMENEIRAHTVYATALLTDALNAIRPAALRLAVPQLDFRLWKAFHAHIRPHHLTRTTMY